MMNVEKLILNSIAAMFV